MEVIKFNKPVWSLYDAIRDIATGEALSERLGEGKDLQDLRTDLKMVWHDEFAVPTINKDKWEHLEGYYDDNRYYMGDLQKNAFASNGILNLTNLRDHPKPECNYSGAFILTNQKLDFRYGWVEARMRFPSTSHVVHSTLWTLGSNYQRNGDKGVPWPYCGEIDIAECDNGIVTATIHWANAQGVHQSYNIGTLSNDGGWHIYGLEWTEESLRFYVDRQFVNGASLWRFDVGDDNPFKHSHYLMLNSNPGLNSESTEDVLTTEVDWVRVYAPTGVIPVMPEEVALNATSKTLSPGSTFDLVPSFADDVIDRTVVWYTTNEDVATVAGGRIIAVGTGVAFIICEHRCGARAMCKVTVNP